MFQVPALQYEYDALSKSISADIMKLHHDKHHQAYVDKLNAAIEPYAASIDGRSIEQLLASIDTLPEAIRHDVRNQGGGHYNHSRFWQWMSPDGGGEPTGALGRALGEKYGSYQEFVDAFTAQATSVFGSGWVWLESDLSIATSANQDTPLIDGRPAPLLGLDVWEHAYYLDYQNKRPDYIAAWWDVVAWENISDDFAAR